MTFLLSLFIPHRLLLWVPRVGGRGREGGGRVRVGELLHDCGIFRVSSIIVLFLYKNIVVVYI